MKNLICFLDSGGIGGAEEYVWLLLEKLDQNCFTPRLTCVHWQGMDSLLKKVEKMGILVDRLPIVQKARSTLIGMLRYISFLRCYLGSLRPDIIHFNQNGPLSCRFAILAAQLAKVPVIVATNHVPSNFPSKPSPPARLVHSLGIKCLDMTITESEGNRQEALSILGIPKGKIEVIYYGIPLEPYLQGESQGTAVRREFGFGDEDLIVGMAGRLDVQKAPEVFLQAAALVASSIPRARFLLVGDGPLRERLEMMVKDLGLQERLVITGWRDDVPRILAALDIFTMSSVFEGLPFAILEAMAAGKAVVATDVGGVKEAVLDGETGLLVPLGRPDLLARAILELLRDAEKRTTMGEAGQRRVQKLFSQERMVRETEKLYVRLLRKKNIR